MRKKIIIGALAAFLILSITAQAGNISLGSSMGIHRFAIQDDKSILISDGFFTVRNSKDHAVDITAEVRIDLIPSEFDSSGNPRTHKIDDHAKIIEMPTADWIIIEDSAFALLSNASHKVSYSLKIPTSSVIDEIDGGDYGYLCYIRITEDSSKAEGSNVGVSYLYKVFVIFDRTSSGSFSITIPLLFISVIAVFLILLIYASKRHASQKEWMKANSTSIQSKRAQKAERRHITKTNDKIPSYPKPSDNRVKYIRNTKERDA